MQDLIAKLIPLIRGAWRYRWAAVGTMWVIAIAGWVVVSKLPDTYEARATVYVDTDSMLRPLLRGMTVEFDVGEKLGLMARQLLSRANLDKVARQALTDGQNLSQTEIDEWILVLESQIHLGQSHAMRPSRPAPPDLYTIHFRDNDPLRAERVVSALLNTFVQDTIGDTRARSDMAQRFLDDQIGDYERRLVEAETRLQQYRREHIDMLPEQGASYYQRLQTARTNLEQVRLEMREAEYRRDELTRQLQGTPAGQRAVGADGAPVQTPTEQRLLTQQQRLDELLLRYTEEHPDVAETRRSIEELERQRDAEQELVRSGAASAGTTTNPLHQQLQLSLGEVEAELAALRVRRDEFTARERQLQRQIETLPEIEAELQRLNRNYEIYREQYNALVTRRESARISEDVEQTGEDVKFRVIDPPRVPVRPIGPPRLILTLGVLMAAGGAGLGLALLLSQLAPAVYGRRMLREVSGLPVFGAVSRTWTPQARRRRYIEHGAFLFSVAALLPVFVVVAYVQLSGKGIGQLMQIAGG
jgi:polysaccharide chain length determinant protein (PEP-CTERM system associated)